jgi:hypothetical protein
MPTGKEDAPRVGSIHNTVVSPVVLHIEIVDGCTET